RKDYKNDKLKTFKPHHISAISFKITSENEVAMIPHMMQVAKILPVLEETLILPSKEVNTTNSDNKSFSRTSMQPVGQSKASTDKKSRKKKNPSSSQPKTSKIVKESSPMKHVVETQHAKEPVATADATKGKETQRINAKSSQENTYSQFPIRRIKSIEKYELGEELLKKLRSNSYSGRVEEDVVSHIAKVLEVLDPIEVAGIDPFQLRTFPLLFSGKARKWWLNEGDGKINTSEELVNKFFSKIYPISYASNYDKMYVDDEEGLDPLKFITWRNSKFKDHNKIDEKTKRALLYSWIEVRNNKGIINEDISSNDTDYTNSSMITKPELKIGDEFSKILHDNSFNGMDESDIAEHIRKVLEITEWIKIPNVDKDELRLNAFSKSLSRDAKKWWNNKGTATT
nr:hypothetical protein [Tanacetum cinerariifolium]